MIIGRKIGTAKNMTISSDLWFLFFTLFWSWWENVWRSCRLLEYQIPNLIIFRKIRRLWWWHFWIGMEINNFLLKMLSSSINLLKMSISCEISATHISTRRLICGFKFQKKQQVTHPPRLCHTILNWRFMIIIAKLIRDGGGLYRVSKKTHFQNAVGATVHWLNHKY